MTDFDRDGSETSQPAVVATIDELRSILNRHRTRGRSIGFVPTMGYLHDGHASLMRAARQADQTVVASIFVNPLQFAPTEDLASYPRDLLHDQEVASRAGVDLLFVPSVEEMYGPSGTLTTVSVDQLSARWDGASRPTHFSGVTTVVAKLFNIVGPCRAYFGLKDFQQLVIIKRMVSDLSIPVEVVGCPIVREPDGLAMSSRNVYLSAEERQAALVVPQALEAGRAAIESGETDPSAVTGAMAQPFSTVSQAQLDYVAAVDPDSLETPTMIGTETQLLVAARIGSTRLIDNATVRL